MITKFLEQNEELEAFITGAAGTGKTTNLAGVIDIIDKMKLNYQVVAYTHKAKDVLISKLPRNTPISTLHSWLKKRPGINEKAEHIRSLLTSKQHGKPEHLELLIVDEFSFVGEKDYYSIGELQDPVQLEEAVTDCRCSGCGGKDITDDGLTCIVCAEDGEFPDIDEEIGEVPKPLKVLYIGDLNQLSPIDGPPAVIPQEPFWTKLTTIHRQSGEGLTEPLQYLVEMIEGDRDIAYLDPTDQLIRKVDIDAEFIASEEEDKIMLAWTNEAVQLHNSRIQGRSFPQSGDLVLNSTLKEKFRWRCTIGLTDDMQLTTPHGIITKDTKYNPFKELRKNKDIIYAQAEDNRYIPCIFGVYANKLIRNKKGKALTMANKNSSSETIRKNTYKAYKVLNDYVSIVDFAHCQTVHKSQGQEYAEVYIDGTDLSKNRDMTDRLKLLYVAMSRGKNKILMNN